MKSVWRAAALLLATAASPCLHAQTELRAELLEMGRLDQEVRERLMALISEGGPDALASEEFAVIADEMSAIDRANLARLDEIVERSGWPGTDVVGEEAAGAARIILLHAPLERQRDYLQVLREAVANGQASAADLAMLEDDVALADDGAQIYGTNVSLEDGRAILSPVVDPARIDERRAAVGLPPIEEYLRYAEGELGMPVDRSALTADPD
jgi:hypothetical protein